MLTVPASFDDVARNLTVEAAKRPGLKNVTLLEEPQAAFYCWLATHSPHEAAQLKPGMRCLVVDVGGGTSDFSLIQAVEEKGELRFVREAVGDHLLLGGDNMDLALAKFVETKLPQAGRLDAAQYGMLTQACRQAKEALLGPKPPASHTGDGHGPRPAGHRRHAARAADARRRAAGDLRRLLPARAARRRAAARRPRPACTRWACRTSATRRSRGTWRRSCSSTIAERPRRARRDPLQRRRLPAGSRCASALVEVMQHWFDQPGKPWQPLVLTNPSLDLAVAWGAAYYAWLRAHRRQAHRRRHRAVVLRRRRDRRRPRMHGQLPVLCVVPQHLEEGAGDRPAEAGAGTGARPAGARSRCTPRRCAATTSRARCCELARAAAAAAAAAHDPARRQAQRARSACRSRWRRSAPRSARSSCTASPRTATTAGGWSSTSATSSRTPATTADERRERAGVDRRLARGAGAGGGAADPRRPIDGDAEPPPQELTKALEAALDAPRDEWPTGLCRRLWEFLAEVAEQPPPLAAAPEPLVSTWSATACGPASATRSTASASSSCGSCSHAPSAAGGPTPAAGRGRRRLLDHVAARRRRAEHRHSEHAVQPPAADPAAGEGQGGRQARARTSWPRCGGRPPAWNGST